MKPSGHFDLRGLLAAASAVVFENERYLVTFVERTQARAFERRYVHKDILRTVSRSDEPETLCTVEKLDCASNPHSHRGLFVACEKAGLLGSRIALATQVRVGTWPVRQRVFQPKERARPTMDRTGRCNMGCSENDYKQIEKIT